MLGTNEFRELIDRVRERDEQAFQELVRRYGPHLERAARAQLLGTRGKLALTTEDVTQAVFLRLHISLTRGQFELTGPAEMIKLLNVLTHNHVIDEYRKEKTRQRKSRRVENCDSEASILSMAVAPTSTPSMIVSDSELDREFRRRLTPEELYLAEQRAAGRSWGELAAAAGSQADALRKRLHRAMARVYRELGLEMPA
jgi:DNA-directed RNA polymerase specialized sigma24 family protein